MTWMCLLLALTVVSADKPDELFRLPGDVIPVHYDLKYTFTLGTDKVYENGTNANYFFGVVIIEIKALKRTRDIILHGNDVKYQIARENITITGPNGIIPVDSVTIEDWIENNTLIYIRPEHRLKKRQMYSIEIPFSGNLSYYPDAYTGILASQNLPENGLKTPFSSENYAIATSFMPHHARSAFPCFDEPQYKATFKLTIGRHKNYSSISNMPLDQTSKTNALEKHWPWEIMNDKFEAKLSDFEWDHFYVSDKMSTYLVAFFVSSFSFIESPPGYTKTLIRSYTRERDLNKTNFGSKLASQMLGFYEDWFNITYPLPKLDLAVVPGYYPMGTTENWGLILYRDSSFLVNPAEDAGPTSQKQLVARYIARNLAQQWLGNFVTHLWWDDLWLTGGLSNMMTTYALKAVLPEYKPQRSDISKAASLSYSVTSTIGVPNQTKIWYLCLWGSVLFHMMIAFLGEDVFRKTIRKFLVKNAYGSIKRADLWNAFDDEEDVQRVLDSRATVEQIMDSWVTKPDVPLVTVTRKYEDNALIITQEPYAKLIDQRFRADSKPEQSREDLGWQSKRERGWWVPLGILVEGETFDPKPPIKWLGDTEGTDEPYILQVNATDDQWVLVNAGVVGPYCVNYDEKNWELLNATLSGPDYETIPEWSRDQLRQDAMDLAQRGLLDYNFALYIAEATLRHQKDYKPFAEGLRPFYELDILLRRTSDYGIYQKFIRDNIVKPKLKQLTARARANNQDVQLMQVANRLFLVMEVVRTAPVTTLLSQWSCRVKVSGCEDRALEMYHQWRRRSNQNRAQASIVPRGIAETAWCVGVLRGTEAESAALAARLRSATRRAERRALLRALACSRDPWILSQWLEWTIANTSELTRSEAGLLMTSIADKANGFDVAKHFLYDRIRPTVYRFGKEVHPHLAEFLRAIITSFIDDEELEGFIQWREENKLLLKDMETTIEQALRVARLNVSWMKHQRADFIQKIKKFGNLNT